MVVLVGVPNFGRGFATLGWVLWWIDAAVSLLCSIGVPYAMFNYHQQSLEEMSGVWFLPIISTIVSSATGGLVAEYLAPAHARLTIICCYILWGIGEQRITMIAKASSRRPAISGTCTQRRHTMSWEVLNIDGSRS